MAAPVFTTSKQIKVGLGDALQRLFAVELRIMNGLSTVEPADLAQRQLILDALNLTQLDLGFDCDNDGVPDTVDIFEQAASTSCCRVVHETEACCRVPVEPAAKQKKARGKSRATPAATDAPVTLEVVRGRPDPLAIPPAPAPVEAPPAPVQEQVPDTEEVAAPVASAEAPPVEAAPVEAAPVEAAPASVPEAKPEKKSRKQKGFFASLFGPTEE